MSEQFNIDEALAEDWSSNIYRFKRTPLPAEIVKLAEAQLAAGSSQAKKVNPKSGGTGKRR